MSRSRLMAEFETMAKNPPPMTSAGPKLIDGKRNLYRWQGKLSGPKLTPYEGGIFEFEIEFSEYFPITPPEVHFITTIYHTNIGKTGWVCLDILGDSWNPSISVSQILLALLNLLSHPNPKDPVEPEIGRLYMEKKHLYNRKAREETNKHAKEKK